MIIKEIVGTNELEVSEAGVKINNPSGHVFIPIQSWVEIKNKVDLMGKIINENTPNS